MLLLELATHDDPIAIYGYSQGARVVSISKQNLVDTLPTEFKDRLSISMTGNISRPNGGAWSRFTHLPTIPILDITFGDPTPTDTGVTTFDTCSQYDGVCDFPNYLVSGLGPNVLAILNAAIGFIYWPHPTYLGPVSPTDEAPLGYQPDELQAQLTDQNNRSVTGDTTYITIPLAPSAHLPIVKMILALTPSPLKPVVDPVMEFAEPIIKWRIDQAFDRTIDPGTPTPIKLFRPLSGSNAAQEFTGFVDAVQQGIADATDGVPIDAAAAPSAAATAVAASAVTDVTGNRAAAETAAADRDATRLAAPATESEPTLSDDPESPDPESPVAKSAPSKRTQSLASASDEPAEKADSMTDGDDAVESEIAENLLVRPGSPATNIGPAS